VERITRDTQVAVVIVATAAVALVAGLAFGLTNSGPRTRTTTRLPVTYPAGIPDRTEPSGRAPPDAAALPGYVRTYVNDFDAAGLPAGWQAFTGVPGGDLKGQFASSHVVVGGGLLTLNTTRDPAYNNEWVTGGVCQCGHVQRYGAYFVRSRVTGPGPNEIQLLWPASNTWPPEIDFSETGRLTVRTTATVHYTSADRLDQATITIDMTRWHTWGVVWTPRSIKYVVDGRVWATVTRTLEVPSQPMTLHLQQQTSCAAGYNYACPQRSQSMMVDWVAEYAPKG
jgi:hypothetical protein